MPHRAGSMGVVIHTERANGAVRAGPAPPLRGRAAGRVTVILLLIVIVGVAVPLLIRLRVGAVPANDEWSYVKAALAMHARHDVELQGFDQMFLIGQLVAAQPFLAAFGAHVATLAVFGAASAALWLCLTFALTRPMTGTSRALVLVAVLAASPIFGLLSSSFMTDVPSAAIALLALYVGVRAFESASVWRLLTAFVLALVAFTFREQSVVVFAVFLSAAWIYRPIRSTFRTLAIAGSVVGALGCLVLEHLRHGVPHGDAPPFGLSSIHALGPFDYGARGVFTIALALSPLTVLLVIRRGRRAPTRATSVTAGIVVIVAGTLLALSPHSVLLGNYLERQGAYGTALVGQPAPAFGPIVWVAVQCLAVGSAVVMCAELGTRVRRWRRRGAATSRRDVRQFMVYAYAALLGAGYVVLAFVGQRQYDRYLLAMLPAVGVLLLGRRRESEPSSESAAPARWPAVLAPALCLAFLLCLSLSLTLTTDVRDAAVWRAAERVTAHGVRPTAINAGSAWNGMHATSPLVRSGVKEFNKQYLGDMWAQFFPGSGDCYAITLSPMTHDTWNLVRVTTAHPYGTDFGTAPVYTYRRTDGHPFGTVGC